MKIENINTGLCHRRVQEGKPAHCVNWVQDGKNQYRFFSIVSACMNFKNSLAKIQDGTLCPEIAKAVLGI